MARSDWSTSNFLRCTTAIATATPLTMAAWCKTSITGSLQVICGLFSSADAFPFNQFLLYVDSTDKVAALTADAAVARQALTSTTISASTVFHACGVWASATDRRAFLNGGGKVTEATSLTPAGIDRTSIGVGDSSSASNPLAPAGTGSLAEVAIWNVALADADVASLALGVHPFMVRPDKLVAYWPMIGTYSPEINRKSNTATMAIQGSLSQSAHPRIFMPSQRGLRTRLSPAPAPAVVGTFGEYGAAGAVIRRNPGMIAY